MAVRCLFVGACIIPAAGLWINFARVQKWYAIVGAAFMPMLALALLLLNGRSQWVGREYRNSVWTSLLLAATLAVFAWVGWYEIRKELG